MLGSGALKRWGKQLLSLHHNKKTGLSNWLKSRETGGTVFHIGYAHQKPYDQGPSLVLGHQAEFPGKVERFFLGWKNKPMSGQPRGTVCLCSFYLWVKLGASRGLFSFLLTIVNHTGLVNIPGLTQGGEGCRWLFCISPAEVSVGVGGHQSSVETGWGGGRRRLLWLSTEGGCVCDEKVVVGGRQQDQKGKLCFILGIAHGGSGAWNFFVD